MAGITQQQVLAAVDALTARGERATIRAVRAELGTGSLGTIQSHMLQVQPGGSAPAAELSPDVLRALAHEVQRVTASAVADLRTQLQTADIDRAALAADVDRLTQELADAVAARDVAQRDLAVTRATLEGVQARLDDAHGVMLRIGSLPASPKKPTRKRPVAPKSNPPL
jgi:aminopeptidase N